MEDSIVLDLQLQVEKMEVTNLKACLGVAEKDLLKEKTNWEQQLKETLVEAKEDLSKKDEKADTALSQARTKVVTKFKSLEEFQECLVTKGQVAMITMLPKL